jgi:valyl-tRNA synthetase
MEKSYDPKQVESHWYQFWLERGYFTASVEAQGLPYCIVIPPPNITGSLHMGHALNATVQDILIRWRRMQGRNTLWIPGTDHAGIATQNVVEKQLLQENATRETVGRDRFVQRVWEWKAQSGGTIIEQLKRLGASCDWTRRRFTMDDGLSRAVREVFVRLYQDGLIYRGKRLINWCPRCLTALSDIEVEHQDTTGKMYYIEYPLAGKPSTRLTVATTRPETMLGDTAVAVHPEDPRYNLLIGQKVRLPLTHREIPIVGDSILVDREFGTGAVKITPGHDFNDFEAGERHKLPRLSLFNQEARMDPWGLREAKVDEALETRLSLKSAQQARAIVVEALQQQGFLSKSEDHNMALGKCYRCKTVVEPYLSPQWFVKIQPLAEPAIRAVESGQIRLIPEQWTNNYLAWMRDIKDWCISRQIWWGHQIPAWYCTHCNEEAIIETSGGGTKGPSQTVSIKKSLFIASEAKPIVARQAPSHCPDCGQHDFIRDPDVLDTWFSSALWPFSTLGWPDETAELKKYYPTSALVTGFDILFFWVARMIMMGLKFMGQVPFRDVYIHALVRDAEGQKMSKSKGNVIDPLTIMDKYGTDALRFTLAAMASPGRDIKLSEERIEGYRNFANKLWNAARFIQMNLDGPREAGTIDERSVVHQWLLSRLHRCIAEVNSSLDTYRFDEAANGLYHFIWHEYCDWYLELVKPALSDKQSPEAAATRAMLVDTFDTLLRLLHPFMPFITEELWQALPHTGDSIMLAPYPTSNGTFINERVEQELESVQKLISGVRDIKGTQGIAPSKPVNVTVATASATIAQSLQKHEKLTRALIRVGHLNIGEGVQHPPHVASTTATLPGGSLIEIGIDLAGVLDVQKEKARVEKRLKDISSQMEETQKKLANSEFVAKVPPEVLEKTRARHQECLLEHEKLSSELTRLGRLARGAP